MVGLVREGEMLYLSDHILQPNFLGSNLGFVVNYATMGKWYTNLDLTFCIYTMAIIIVYIILDGIVLKNNTS